MMDKIHLKPISRFFYIFLSFLSFAKLYLATEFYLAIFNKKFI